MEFTHFKTAMQFRRWPQRHDTALLQRLALYRRLAAFAFCPTGDGGGIDNSCSPSEGGMEGNLPDRPTPPRNPISKSQFRKHLNEAYGMGGKPGGSERLPGVGNIGLSARRAAGAAGQRKRPYGDYLYAVDKENFNYWYGQYLKGDYHPRGGWFNHTEKKWQHQIAALAQAELARLEYDHKFSTTQVNLPQELQDELQAWVDSNISPDDLHPTEKQEPPFHVTVKYGLHAKDPAAVEEILEGWGPVDLTLGSIDTFTTNADYDVLIVRVQSDDLVSMNHALSDALPHTDTQASYNPHVTLAYLKKGAGEKWIDRKDFFDRRLTIDEVQFGSADDDIGKTNIPLTREFTCTYCGLHRYHLPGQHDQCDHSPTGECSRESETPERKALFEEERKIRGNAYETAYAIDSVGRIRLQKRGDDKSVAFTKAEIAQVENLTFTHNHPKAVGLSATDARFAIESNVKEIRAVGILGYGPLRGAKVTYIIKRPPNGWPNWENEGAKKWVVAERVVTVKFYDRIQARALTVDEASALHHNAVNALYAKSIGADFRVILTKAGR